MSNIIKELPNSTARKSVSRRVFPCIRDLLVALAENAPECHAILTPGRLPMTYGALWTQAKDVVFGLRNLGVRRTDRVAVVLSDGPEAAVAAITVAAGAVRVPLNPGFTCDEYQRYFGELHLAALLTHADLNSACRRAARIQGVPVIDVSMRPDQAAGAFSVADRAPQGLPDDGFASSADDAFILMTSGSTSRPKTVPLTHARRVLRARAPGRGSRAGDRHRRAHLWLGQVDPRQQPRSASCFPSVPQTTCRSCIPTSADRATTIRR
ncbi:AMP-binding protein [Bradyrhizobium sp. Pear77]|nr:AMP-binding protein [Bradyrhizobium altum]